MLSDFVSLEPIRRGWSGDKKYCAVTADGTKYLLRITPEEKSARRERSFRWQQKAAALGIPMCRPVAFGRCGGGAYTVLTWVEGREAEEVIPQLSREKQYAYGVDAGKVLQKIHSIPAPDDLPDWEVRFGQKIDRKLDMYERCPLKYENGDAFLTYLAENRSLLAGRPQTYQHGDFHIGNMMIDTGGVLTVIDFDRDDCGDPWEEFNRIVWCAQASADFASGMVDGYFNGRVPMAFWKLLALYICSNALSSLPWAVSYGEGEIAVMRAQAAEILRWYDNMRHPVPSWYTAPQKAKSAFTSH